MGEYFIGMKAVGKQQEYKSKSVKLLLPYNNIVERFGVIFRCCD
jgi:hypothetical protein